MSLYKNLEPEAAAQAQELALPAAEAFLLSAAISARRQAETAADLALFMKQSISPNLGNLASATSRFAEAVDMSTLPRAVRTKSG